VLKRESEAVREFLVRTCILDRLSEYLPDLRVTLIDFRSRQLLKRDSDLLKRLRGGGSGGECRADHRGGRGQKQFVHHDPLVLDGWRKA
jgi:hypothetical protein